MTKCQNVNCYNGKNCPITQEVHDLVNNQKRKAELKRLDNCFRIIEHEIILNCPLKFQVILLEKLNSLKRELI
jgi:hypothetical protein